MGKCHLLPLFLKCLDLERDVSEGECVCVSACVSYQELVAGSYGCKGSQNFVPELSTWLAFFNQNWGVQKLGVPFCGCLQEGLKCIGVYIMGGTKFGETTKSP